MAQQTVVKISRDKSELEHIRPIWEGWNNHPNSDIDFYLTILDQRPEILRPHVMVAYQGECPQAMLVGRIERKGLAYKIGYLNLFRPTVRMLTLPFGGFLGEASPENCAALIAGVIDSLRRGEADLAVFEPLDTKSTPYHYIQTSPAWFCRDYIHTSQVHRSMTLFESAEAFYQSLSSKVRKNVKWQAKKLLADYSGAVRIDCHNSPTHLDALFAEVEAIAKKTYQRGLGVGFSDNPEMRARLKLEAEKGWLRAYILYLAEKPCAFWLGAVYKDTFHSNFMGYDPAFAKHSPGMYLVTKVIEDLCKPNGASKLAQLDFGLGDAQYKQVLGTHSWDESGPYIFVPSLKGFSLNVLRTSLGLVDKTARKALGRTKLLSNLKNSWRKSVRQHAPPPDKEQVC